MLINFSLYDDNVIIEDLYSAQEELIIFIE